MILVPVVHSPHGRAAIERAMAEARLRSQNLLLVGHVQADDQATERVEQMRDSLDELERRIEAQGVSCETQWSVGAQTVDEIVLELASDRDAELIVLGLRRRSPVGKLVLGSYEQQILLQAECPVLAVKADDEPKVDN